MAAGLMRGFAGFGSAMLMAPVYSLLYGPLQAVAKVMLLETAVTLQLLPGALPRTRWREIGAPALAALAPPLRRLHHPSPRRRHHAPGHRRRGAGVQPGDAQGLALPGTEASGGDATAQNRADLITTFALIGGAALGLLLVAGAIGAETVSRALVLAPAFVLAALAGSRVFRHSGEALYRRVALNLLLAVGLGTLIACAPRLRRRTSFGGGRRRSHGRGRRQPGPGTDPRRRRC